MADRKRIVFTGGGTAGHVTPNIALIEKLICGEWDIHYLGTETGMEHELIGALPDVTYHTISSGKLRRYHSWQNLLDPFRVLKGVAQSKRILRELKPDVVFSKGGFVSVPVVMAAGKVPVVAHESDYTPGLANRIASFFTDTICVTFEDTLALVPGHKGVFTGTPIRPELYEGDRDRALAFTGLSGSKPVLLAMGGSLGAQRLNELLREALPLLAGRYDVIHLCGHGKIDKALHRDGYLQYAYIDKELPDLLALADIVLSRAGANAVFELLALKKPAVLMPLTAKSSRGDQLLNAAYFDKKGYARAIDEETASAETLAGEIDALYRGREAYMRAMERDARSDGTDAILSLIKRAANA